MSTQISKQTVFLFFAGFLAGWGFKYIWKAAALQLSDPIQLGYGVKVFQLTKAGPGVNEVWFGEDDAIESIIAVVIAAAGKKSGIAVSLFGLGMLLGILSVKAYEIIQKVQG